MEGPNIVRLQRKRNEKPPERLVVQRNTPVGTQHADKRKAEEIGPTTYVLKTKRSASPDPSAGEAKKRQLRAPGSHGEATSTSKIASEGLTQPAEVTNRTFHLRTPTSHSQAPQTGSLRKRKHNDVATVIEKRPKIQESNADILPHGIQENIPSKAEPVQHEPEQSRPFKRPGRSSALRRPADGMDVDPPKQENSITTQRKKMEALAEEMHQFALDEIAKTPKPQVHVKPKLSAARAQARHRELASATPQTKLADPDVDMHLDSDGDYVYDTYVIATPTTNKKTDAENPSDVLRFRDVEGNVGYLVITEADEEAWENYMDENGGNDSEETDEDDENAEDYYGADYPSDELASDDEYDRNAYGYRAGAGSDDEQYDKNTGAWSDEDEDHRDRSRMPGNFEKYLSERRGANGLDDDAWDPRAISRLGISYKHAQP